MLASSVPTDSTSSAARDAWCRAARRRTARPARRRTAAAGSSAASRGRRDLDALAGGARQRPPPQLDRRQDLRRPGRADAGDRASRSSCAGAREAVDAADAASTALARSSALARALAAARAQSPPARCRRAPPRRARASFSRGRSCGARSSSYTIPVIPLALIASLPSLILPALMRRLTVVADRRCRLRRPVPNLPKGNRSSAGRHRGRARRRRRRYAPEPFTAATTRCSRRRRRRSSATTGSRCSRALDANERALEAARQARRRQSRARAARPRRGHAISTRRPATRACTIWKRRGSDRGMSRRAQDRRGSRRSRERGIARSAHTISRPPRRSGCAEQIIEAIADVSERNRRVR